MSQTHNCARLFSFFECNQQARIMRSLIIQACMRSTMRAFAHWLRVLALRGTRWARGRSAQHRLRRGASSTGSTIVCWPTSASPMDRGAKFDGQITAAMRSTPVL